MSIIDDEIISCKTIFRNTLTVAQTRPLTALVKLKNVIEVGLLFPSDYPQSPLLFNIFIPEYLDDAKGNKSNQLYAHLQVFIDNQTNIEFGYLFAFIKEVENWIQENMKKVGNLQSIEHHNSQSIHDIDFIGCSATVRSAQCMDAFVQSRISIFCKQHKVGRAVSKQLLHDAMWDPTKTKKPLSTTHGIVLSNTTCCLGCMDELGGDSYKTAGSTACNHYMCAECWRSYIKSNISDGKVIITCPGFKCERPVPENIIMCYLNVKQYSQYRRWLTGSLISFRNWKKCPQKGCLYLGRADKEEDTNVNCVCNMKWCVKCKEESHYPISCSVFNIYRNSSLVKDLHKVFKISSLDTKPIDVLVIETKSCPKCKHVWNKDGGCNHFRCTCGYHFCWICLKCWDNHGGSYYECTKPKSKNSRSTTRYFYEGDNPTLFKLPNSTIKQFIDKEMFHFAIAKRFKHILQTKKEKKKILKEHKKFSRQFLTSTLNNMYQIHIILCNIYIFCCIHVLISVSVSRQKVDKLLKAVGRLEYYVDILDGVFIVMSWCDQRRSRDRTQIKHLLQLIQQKVDIVFSLIPSLEASHMRTEHELKTIFKREQLINKKLKGWSCNKCTYYNTIDKTICNVCNSCVPRSITMQMKTITRKIDDLEKNSKHQQPQKEKLLTKELLNNILREALMTITNTSK